MSMKSLFQPTAAGVAVVGPGQQGQYDQLAAPAAETAADTAAADSRPAAEAETETSAEQLQQPTRGQYSDPVTAGGPTRGQYSEPVTAGGPIRGQYSDPVTAGGPIRGQDEAGSSSSVELRRYVAEVSASAEAVDQLQRQGGLDLQVGL